MKTKLFLILWCIMAIGNTKVQAQNLNLVWAKPGGNKAIAFDAVGNIYTMGQAENAYGFGIIKSDALGNIIWTKSVGISGSTGLGDDNFGASFVVDALGNVYVTGQFRGNVDFDPADNQNIGAPGPGAFYMTTSSYGSDTGPQAFITKLDTNGNFVWAKQFGQSSGVSVVLDASGNILVTGYFGGGLILTLVLACL